MAFQSEKQKTEINDNKSKGMNTEDEEWIKQTIVEAERRRCISKILAVDCSNAVSDGNNYISDIFRLKLKVVNNGGELEERSVIYKTIPAPSDSKMSLDDLSELGLYVKEIRIYTEIFPEMEKIVRQKEPNWEPIWPQIIAAKHPYQAYLMEDLSVKGYQMLDRRKGLNFDQCRIAVKALGRYHGLTAILIEKRTLRLDDYNGMYFAISEREKCKEMYRSILTSLATVLENNWKGEWIEYVEKVNHLKETILQKLLKIAELDENRFSVLNHGDFWLNNIMFKMDKEGNPIDVRVIDFQMAYYNTPCIDLHYLFSSSMQPELFPRKKELLAVYHESLQDTLQRFGYEGKIPTFENIAEDFDRTRLFGLGISLTLRAFMTVPRAERTKKYPEAQKKDMSLLCYLYDGEYFVKSLKTILKEANESRLLDVD